MLGCRSFLSRPVAHGSPLLSQDGIVNVSAKDKATNKDQSMTIASSSGLSDSQIEKMVKDAEAFAEQDKAKRELIEMSVGSDSTCTDTQKCESTAEHVSSGSESQS